MKNLLEKILTMTLVMIYIIALTICWVCVVYVSYEIFLPIALLLSALAGVFIVGAIWFRN